ncbi:OmpA-OmpF porin, OOP family [Dyadobacter koreensis]|uniref:OmpA-OmpF porin, OOP family n=1 Tax=Dyadobacter koreensis TaxID=408657 RepID=A0A1H7B479_9BACT|nr:OmpA family protein [Dyadobacter koreensis]SEJ68205.1 OmpA-OmpF porin, OOP family [Dyadobacter koreensis]
MSNNKTLWWILLIGWMGGSTYWHVCKIKQLCDAPLSTSTVDTDTNTPTISITPLTIADGTEFNLQSPGNFGFAKSGADANLSGVQAEIDSLASFAAANPGKIITITGLYTSEETNSTTFPNLGVARAAGIKKYLTGKGLPDSLFVLNGKLSDGIVFDPDSMSGGIDFTFAKRIAVTETDLANEQKYESIFKPLDLYFPAASAEYIKTAENEKFLKEAKKFLSDNNDKKLLLTGHTDSDDSAEWNLKLSKKRANIVKAKFVALGMPADRIITNGKGEAEPKASNDSPAGKRANRRVTIIVQ